MLPGIAWVTSNSAVVVTSSSNGNRSETYAPGTNGSNRLVSVSSSGSAVGAAVVGEGRSRTGIGGPGAVEGSQFSAAYASSSSIARSRSGSGASTSRSSGVRFASSQPAVSIASTKYRVASRCVFICSATADGATSASASTRASTTRSAASVPFSSEIPELSSHEKHHASRSPSSAGSIVVELASDVSSVDGESAASSGSEQAANERASTSTDAMAQPAPRVFVASWSRSRSVSYFMGG